MSASNSFKSRAAELVTGVGSTTQGALGLRIHGELVCPPSGSQLLFVFGDLGAPPKPGAMAHFISPSMDFRQRALKARCPVVDLFWSGKRLRIPAFGVAWVGLPKHTLSSPLNMVELVMLLTSQSGGALLDLGFDPDTAKPIAGGSATELVEHADRGRSHAFDGYCAHVADRWQHGDFPQPRPGQLLAVRDPTPGIKLEGEPRAPLATVAAPKVPWIRRGGRAKLRWSLGSWMAAGPIAFLALLPRRVTLDDFLWPSCAGLAVCGGAIVAMGLGALRQRLRLLAVPQSKVRSMAMGPVEVAGRAEATAPLCTSTSGIPCVWYQWERQRLEKTSKGSSWRTVLQGGITDIPFRINDGTGAVLIQPVEAEVDLDPVETKLSDDLRMREWVIPVGAQATIVGVAQHRTSGEEERVELVERLRHLKHDSQALQRYGVAPGIEPSLEQWERARADVEKEVVASFAARARDQDDVFIGAGAEFPFVITLRSRESEAAYLRTRFWTGAAVGSAYLTVAAAILLRRLFG